MQHRRRTKKFKRLKDERKSFNIIQKIILQTVLCIFLVAVAGIIKGIDSPVTNYFENKITGVLTHNVDIKGFFYQMDTLIQKKDDERQLNSNEHNLENQKQIAISDGEKESINIKDDYEKISMEKSNVPSEEFLEETFVDSISYNVDDENDIDYENFSLEYGEYSFIIPVGGTISTFFGEQTDSINDVEQFHEGINIETEMGTPIKAVYSGEVLEIGEDSKKGKFIEIKHRKDIRIIYSNCSSLLVEKGQYINRGDIIGQVGNTGNFKNPSLYLVLLKDDVPENPLDYIEVLSEQEI